jgi:hypothetical protein
MNKLSVIDKWNKIDNYTAKSSNDSKVWFDTRELVGYERPDKLYVSLGASISNNLIKSSANNKVSLKRNKTLIVFVSNELHWEQNGYSSGMRIEGEEKFILLKNIKNGMKSLGFIVYYQI